jgi:hypothetical protein
MVAPFAALEARVNAAVFAKLANATADFGGGVVVAGVFDSAYADAFGLVGGAVPVFQCAAAAVSAVAVGAAVTINAVSYTVAEIEPDGAGMTRLRLKS